jgi:predicted lipoprotein with Yx(FWY)xxD motif
MEMRKATLLGTQVFAALVVLLIAGTAFTADKMPAGVQARKADSGTVVLADAKGMTLYTFDKDMKGMSMCSGKCAMNWPPLAADADAKPVGDWTIVKRDDGSMQWAYKGKPLYTFAKDANPGETKGEGVGTVWHAVTP